ncbi:MAG: flagellar hook-associated protein FlgK [Candidatus Manganitrophus sp. SA1]|nr:flagellar hook-associated protein FlgK [Candidatus Manganitrophus morganii]
MSSIFGIFNIGRLALFANQRALSVTSQNIANVNTPGYTRQQAIFSSTTPMDSAPGQLGTGVQITEVRRVFDKFIQDQLTAQKSNLGRFGVERGALGRVEAVFNDSDGVGLHQSLSEFFAAFHDLANNPQGLPERVSLMEQARTLSANFAQMNDQLQQIRKDLNTEVEGVLGEVNTLATQIADLNGQIAQVTISGQNANDLRDQRERLLQDLAEKINFSSFENDLGEVSILIGGKLLVESTASFTLRGVVNQDNAGFADVGYDPGTGTITDITSFIENGRLKGLVDLRDTILPGYINQLDQMAAVIVNEVNQQHRAGYGLDGSTGNDFFSPLAPTVTGLSGNTGSGTMAATVNDPSLLTLDSYQLTFAGANYTIQNLRTGSSATAAYVDPTTVTFEGIQIAMSGAPANGDTFEISAHQGMSGSIALSAIDPNEIAASSTAAGVPGDNSNALLLAQLQEKEVTGLGEATFQSFYSQYVGEIGSRSRLAQRSLLAEQVIDQNLIHQREEISGVSLDEETANLIKFQRAFEASARLISVADELLQTILAIKR